VKQAVFFVLCALIAFGGAGLLTGCDKKSGDAVVLAKEHIAAAEVQPSPASDAATPRAIPGPGSEEVEAKPLAADEIVVDQIVMTAAVRGTGKDPRAIADEQWRVTVKLSGNGLQFNVQSDKGQWEKIKVGDRVHVKYSQGKYTGTVWGAEIQ
jgi:hypothetical protein